MRPKINITRKIIRLIIGALAILYLSAILIAPDLDEILSRLPRWPQVMIAIMILVMFLRFELFGGVTFEDNEKVSMKAIIMKAAPRIMIFIIMIIMFILFFHMVGIW